MSHRPVLASQPRCRREIAPGIRGLELVVGAADGKRTLVIRDAQHAYTFTEN